MKAFSIACAFAGASLASGALYDINQIGMSVAAGIIAVFILICMFVKYMNGDFSNLEYPE